jgi:hypothetical protein
MTRVATCFSALLAALAAAPAPAQLHEYTLAGGARFSRMTVDRTGDAVVLQKHRLLLIRPDGRLHVLAANVSGDVGWLAALPDGRIAMSRPGQSRVLAVDSAGAVSTFAGADVAGYRGDGGSAAAAQLHRPVWLSPLEDGTLAIADDMTIRGVDSQGVMHGLVGQPPCLGNEGGAAVAAEIETPTAIAALSDGSVAFGQNGCVRRVAPDGAISTLAGTGVTPYYPDLIPDDGIAANTQLGQVQSIAGLPDGSVIFSDDRAVRRITPDGRLTVIAGCAGSCEKPLTVGAPARGAPIHPIAVAARPDGTILVGDTGLPGVVSLTSDGTIAAIHQTTALSSNVAFSIAATPDGGFAIAGGPVVRVAADGTESTLSHVYGIGVAALPDDSIAVADGTRVTVYPQDGTAGPVISFPTTVLGATADGTLLGAADQQLLRVLSGVPTLLAGTGARPGLLHGPPDGRSWGPGPLAAGSDDALLFLAGRSGTMAVRRRDPSGTITTLASLHLCGRSCPFEWGDMPPGVALSGAPDGGAYVAALGRIVHVRHGLRAVLSHAGSAGFFGDSDGSTPPVVATYGTSDLHLDGGDLLFLEDGHLRVLAHPGTRRFAVAIPKETLAVGAARRVAVMVTQPARVRVEVRSGGRVVARRTVTIEGARKIVRLPRSLPAGEYTVRVLARGLDDRAARASTEHRLLLGGELSPSIAKQLLRRAGLPSFRKVRVADFTEEEDYTTRHCMRLLTVRVDCEVDHYYTADYTEEECYRQAVVLQPTGVVTLRAYAERPRSCTKRAPLPVEVYPRWDSPLVQAPPL